MNLFNANHLELSSDELERYSRHLLLPEIGENGQRRLKNSSVICIGCGGLGSPLLLYLAAAGIGHIGIVDSDLVEKSNLQRQVIHETNSIGNTKIESAKKSILALNPNINVEVFNTLLTTENALEILQPFDVICDCTDNFESRYLINDASEILGKPNIYGAIAKFEGHSTVFNLREGSPTFRDLIPEPPDPELMPSCSEAGVMGILPGLVGIIQASETIKIITEIGDTLDGRLLVIDALTMKFKELSLRRDKLRKPIIELIDYQEFCSSNKAIKNSIPSISVFDLKELLEYDEPKVLLIDVRTTREHNIQSINQSISIPLERIKSEEYINKIKDLSCGKKLFIHCSTGKRSIQAAMILKDYGIEATNILGGIEAWSQANF
ncbi:MULTISPECIES: molybdopterin-synthase adenylyltransferase MoeB [Prochlorococcus]|uniref:Dinucleotide-utilizing enzyme n=1 Tax=Prochlorococcus marinus (strain SARG / CCMP1375 / SS120) TaxID=167539 RepID=Q7V9V0_PROMA|nr:MULTISPECIES: molybdopterin-synthase adenylyltransferase MoeB [Prochlorococcus]AAQ00768.1 Dinucleotide-utilizing enzyme [Prochlorococcus marinus subsp. marinus str. CCMP1375]KGG10737.1 Sulfur carrier protein adenylyltransferase ThiF [Prochlorococcus marinus str. LG]KGG21159.1 Sulfur carrier protein adenylyltransferase ThiF [Prochlorococcus marinus str. SS2]KGG23983.1 Sulfur carrier protein adenylyltransferase ThiF [Prochlorococcus marinus str. SS35]KGG31757.1 Sulfur carrier protein adenylyl